MIFLIGASGYIGSEFSRQLNAIGAKWLHAPYHDLTILKGLIMGAPKWTEPVMVINCAAFIPKPSVALCDQHPQETIEGNVLFPMRVSNWCNEVGVPFAHISTGCLWNDGMEHGEDDPPQRAFTGHCGFYVGTKVLAEQEVRKHPKHYIWRVRLPFDHLDSDRNYLSKLAAFDQVWHHTNSASHRGDFVKACLDLWERKAPFGTYNVTNPGALVAGHIVNQMDRRGLLKKRPEILRGKSEGECRLSVAKLLAAGVKMRSAEEALEDSLQNWVPRT